MGNSGKKLDVEKTIREILNDISREADEDKGVFWNAFKERSDRGFAILMGSVMDNTLERLIEAAYVKDNKVKQLFKEERILGTTMAKIKIAYFSGYLPEYIYHDLILVNTIRNKFAHEIIADLSFENEPIKQYVDNCVLAYDPIKGFVFTKLKFMLVVTQIHAILETLARLLRKIRPWHLMEILDFNELNFEGWRLTTAEIAGIFERFKKLEKKQDSDG
jgi:DNA-binding MltR family transcriptional regulator